MYVPGYFKELVMSSDTLRRRIDDWEDVAGQYFLSTYIESLNRVNEFHKFIFANEDSFKMVLKGNKFEGRIRRVIEDINAAIEKVANKTAEVHSAVLSEWEKIQEVVEERSAPLDAKQLSDNGQWLFDAMKDRMNVVPPEDLGNQEEVYNYLALVMGNTGFPTFSDVILLNKMMGWKRADLEEAQGKHIVFIKSIDVSVRRIGSKITSIRDDMEHARDNVKALDGRPTAEYSELVSKLLESDKGLRKAGFSVSVFIWVIVVVVVVLLGFLLAYGMLCERNTEGSDGIPICQHE